MIRFLISFFILVFVTTLQARDLLVLQCGSDWCESGEYVRRVFESTTFRNLLENRFEFAVYDDMDEPSPTVKEANQKLNNLRVVSKRFPAITCVTESPRRFFAQLENIPFDISANDLADKILNAVKAKNAALELFAKAKTSNDIHSIDAYGKGFEILLSLCGEDYEKSLREGCLAWKEEWDKFNSLDKDDRTGWMTRFKCGTGITFIEKATEFRKKGDSNGGEKHISALRAIPTNHLTVVQRQSIDIAEYAFRRMDKSRSEYNKKILRHALSLGRDTVWGQCALGYLMIAGEKFTRRERYRVPVLPRPAAEKESTKIAKFPLAEDKKIIASISPNATLTEVQRHAIARYAVLRRIGKKGWNALNSRKGSKKFVKEFFSDCKWMEDFVWSGACENWAAALLALESIVFQDGGRWIVNGDCVGRRFATALALTVQRKDEAFLADVLDAYRGTALAKRLHKNALTQPVWLWRLSLRHYSGESHPASVPKTYDYTAELAEQQRLLDYAVNMPLAAYSGAAWIVPWRNDNCFGEWVQRSKYYEPWVESREWILRRYTPIIGGVCGELSKFGSACANAHGLPSAPVGQPRHCAYTQRQKDGSWKIHYSITAGTGFSSILPFRDTSNWTYFQAHEGAFGGDREKRLEADRILELAALAERTGKSSEIVGSFFTSAVREWPAHYVAWRRMSDWILRAKRPIEQHRLFIDECVVALKGWRQPLWDLLTPYFERVAKESGVTSLTDELVRLAPTMRQGDKRIQEEGFFDRMLTRWTKPIERDAVMMERVVCAMLDAQRDTSDRFAQVVSWCASFMLGDDGRTDRFATRLNLLCANTEKGSEHTKINFGKYLLSASKQGDATAFRRAAELQRRFVKPEIEGKPYPSHDFGGVLLSTDALLKTSTTSCWEDPGMYAFTLDTTPLRGNGFHTDKEKSPWATVELSGPCMVYGILVVNKTPCAYYRRRQVPIEVEISADGKSWRTVLSDEVIRDEYRVVLQKGGEKIGFVRVRRKAEVRDDVFHLNKILVYGKKLY